MHRLLAIVLLSLLVFAADSSFMATPALGATSTSFSPSSVNLATGQSTTITIAAVGLAARATALQFNILHNTGNTRISNAQCVGLFAGFDVGHGTQANGDFFTCISQTGFASGTSGNVLSFTLTNTGGGSDTLSFNNAVSFYLQANLTSTEPLGTTNTLVVTGSLTADLSIIQTASPNPPLPSQNLTYTLTVGNNGPSNATGVVVSDTLPANTTFVSATPSQGTCTGTTALTCSLGNVPAFTNMAVNIVVKAPSIPGTTLTNTASVTGAQSDPNTSNNSTALPLQVQAGGGLPNSYVVLLDGINSHQFSNDSGDDVLTDFRDIRKALGINVIYFSYSAGLKQLGQYCQGWQGNNCTDSGDMKSLYIPPSYGSNDTHRSIDLQAAALDWLLNQIVKQDKSAQIHLGGYSLGGVVASRWVHRYGTPPLVPGSGSGALGHVRSIVLLESPVGGIPVANGCIPNPLAEICGLLDSFFGHDVLVDLQLPIDPTSSSQSIIPSLQDAARYYPTLAIESTADYLVNGVPFPFVLYGLTPIGNGTQSWTAPQLTRRANRQLGPGGLVDPTKPIELLPGRSIILANHGQPLHEQCAIDWIAKAVRDRPLSAGCQ